MKEPLERIQAVHIVTGEVREVAVRPDSGITEVWFPESLRKDGQPPLNRYRDGQLKPDYAFGYYARVDAGREEKAALIRLEIAGLLEKVSLSMAGFRAGRRSAEARLIALYTEEAAK